MVLKIVVGVFAIHFLISAIPLPALAQSLSAANINAAQAELRGARAEEGAAVKEMSLVADAAAPKLKEQKLWVQEIDKLRPLYANYKKVLEPHNADAAKQRAAVQRHNSGCTGKVPKPQYDRCMGEKPHLRAWKSRIDTRKANLERQLSGLNSRRDRIVARSKVLESELAPYKARFNAAKAKLDNARKRIAKAENWLRQARERCANAKDNEALHHCNSVTWDGTSPNRPPLTNPKPPFSATAN